MSIPMDNGMASSNQMKGGNPIAGLRLGSIASRRKARSKSSGGGQQFDKAYFENLAELETHREQLRRTGVESDANVNDLAITRSYNIDGNNPAAGHIQGRAAALRDETRYHDAEGNVLGEVPMDDKLMGISTKGMRMPVKPEGESDDDPKKGQQMRRVAPVTEGTEIPFTKKSVHANDKRAEQARIDASYGLGERSITDVAHESEAPARLEAAADVVMPKRKKDSE